MPNIKLTTGTKLKIKSIIKLKPFQPIIRDLNQNYFEVWVRPKDIIKINSKIQELEIGNMLESNNYELNDLTEKNFKSWEQYQVKAP